MEVINCIQKQTNSIKNSYHKTIKEKKLKVDEKANKII